MHKKIEMGSKKIGKYESVDLGSDNNLKNSPRPSHNKKKMKLLKEGFKLKIENFFVCKNNNMMVMVVTGDSASEAL